MDLNNPPYGIRSLVGRWVGTNKVWLAPGMEALESLTSATLSLTGRDQFVEIRYTWSADGETQDGLLVIRLVETAADIDACWLDSFHTGGGFMTFRRAADDTALVSLLGSYPAPEGPDWGWRIALHADKPDAWRLVMYNIMPDGPEMLAVEGQYTRR